MIRRLLAHICVPNRALHIENDEDNLPTYCAWLKSEEEKCRPR